MNDSHVSLASQIVNADASAMASSKQSEERAVSSDLSPDEWIVLDDVGYEPCGLVSGAAVFHIGLVGVRRGNREVEVLTSALLGAREAATTRLKDDAHRVGASGVVGVRIRIEALEDKHHLARIVAVGTGIRAKGVGEREVFLSDLSGQGFAVLAKGGYLPVGLVMGVCVYHVGRQGLRQWARNQLRNIELIGYTEALYEARELAMLRLQKEAMDSGAEGVVGVTTSELSHVWGNHTIEFFAMGTAVRATKETEHLLDPQIALSLRDPAVTTDPGAIVGSSETQPEGET